MNWDWIRSNIPQIVDATIDHLILTVIAVGVGFVISFGCALLIYRERRFYGPLSGISGVIYTIPSLALLAFLVPVTGLSVAHRRDRADRLHAADPDPEHRRRA